MKAAGEQDMTYYCTYQNIVPDIAVFGIGMTEAESIEDAQKWTNNIESLETGECTKRLYDFVKKNGSDKNRQRINSDGIVDLRGNNGN